MLCCSDNGGEKKEKEGKKEKEEEEEEEEKNYEAKAVKGRSSLRIARQSNYFGPSRS